MLRYSKSENYNGTSMVKDEKGNSVIAATMNGNVNSDGSRSCNSNISDNKAYELNKAEVIADIREFENIIYGVNVEEE